jgi:hypothetical protein
MDNENYHTREVYANFGLAVYHAQVLEYGLRISPTLAKIFPDLAIIRELYEPVMEQYLPKYSAV